MRILKIGEKKFDLNKKTLIMGILNVTPDSFSDGGKFYSIEKAVQQAIKMEKQGADIIDIGGESTRPGAKKITIEEEIKRILPVIKQLKNKIEIPISIDTYKSEVAKKTIEYGANMINDITALRGDKKLAEIISDYDLPVSLMHMKGTPENMQKNPEYANVIKEIKEFLQHRAEYAITKGIKKENIIIDPGIGFGKRTGKGIEDNIEIIKKLEKIKKLGYPVLIGASRKTFIGNIGNNKESLKINERLEGSLAAACVAVINGADILRVHDVLQTKKCIKIVDYTKK